MKPLIQQFGSFRKELLRRMEALTKDSRPEDVRAVNGVWLAFKREVGDYVAKDIMYPETPWDFFEAWIWPTSEWRNFDRSRRRTKNLREDFRKKKSKLNRQSYKDRKLAEEMLPEEAQRALREERAAKRRAQRAAKKLRDSQEAPEAREHDVAQEGVPALTTTEEAIDFHPYDRSQWDYLTVLDEV
jgi:hypothetical protein